MSARGAHLLLGTGEALIRTRRSFERGRSLNIVQKTLIQYFSGKNKLFHLKSIYKRNTEVMNSFLSVSFSSSPSMNKELGGRGVKVSFNNSNPEWIVFL